MWLQLYDRAQVDWSRDFVFSISSLVFKGLQTNEMFYFDLHTTEDDTTSVSAYNRRPKLIIIVCFIEVANCVLRVCKASIVPNNSVFFKSSVPMINYLNGTWNLWKATYKKRSWDFAVKFLPSLLVRSKKSSNWSDLLEYNSDWR